MTDLESQSEFEQWKHENLMVKDGEILTYTQKWNKLFSAQISIETFESCWQAACASTEKRLLAARVQGPSDEEISKLAGMTDDPISIRAAIDWYRDNSKLVLNVPSNIQKCEKCTSECTLTVEQLLPSERDVDYEILKIMRCDFTYTYSLKVFYKWLRDFISKRLAGM